MATATASTTGRAPCHLVTVAVSSYPDAGDDFTKAIAEQVEIVTEWAGVPGRFTHLTVDPDDVCALRKVTKGWLYDQVQARRIPHVRLCGHFRSAGRRHWTTRERTPSRRTPTLGTVSPRTAPRSRVRKPSRRASAAPMQPVHEVRHDLRHPSRHTPNYPPTPPATQAAELGSLDRSWTS
jgi:hypothetical protein